MTHRSPSSSPVGGHRTTCSQSPDARPDRHYLGLCRVFVEWVTRSTVPVMLTPDPENEPLMQIRWPAYRNLTDGLRITRGTRRGCTCASCTDCTDHRTDGTHDAWIIRHAVPRTVPRSRRRLLEGLDRCDRRSPGPDAGVGTPGGSRLTGANGQQVRILTVTHRVWRSTRYPPYCSADPAGLATVLAAPNWTFCSRCTARQRVASRGTHRRSATPAGSALIAFRGWSG